MNSTTIEFRKIKLFRKRNSIIANVNLYYSKYRLHDNLAVFLGNVKKHRIVNRPQSLHTKIKFQKEIHFFITWIG